MCDEIEVSRKDKQALIDRFYDLDNFVTYDVAIDPAIWAAILAEEPIGGHDYHYPGKRWINYKTISVTITGSKFPSRPVTYYDVTIRKKSFHGSFSTVKPSFHLKFPKRGHGHCEVAHEKHKRVEHVIGTNRMTLNNSFQDPIYFRQPIGYYCLRKAGVPALRCNMAQVIVNGGAGQLYVNLESFKRKFIKHVFPPAHFRGNAYEIEGGDGDDLDPDTITRPGWMQVKGFSANTSKADVLFAAKHITSNGVSGMRQVVDVDAFIRFYVGEIMIQEMDGYCYNQNNTFIYNNEAPVKEPGIGDVKLELIPSGIDLCLNFHPSDIVWLPTKGLLANMVTNDPALRRQAHDWLQSLTQNSAIFSQEHTDKVLDICDKLVDQVAMYGYAIDPFPMDNLVSQVAQFPELAAHVMVLLKS